MNVPDIGSIPISLEDYINESNNITQEQIENIMFPEVISPLQQNNRNIVISSQSVQKLQESSVNGGA